MQCAVGGVDRVGAVASKELIRNAILSVAIASALILVYLGALNCSAAWLLVWHCCNIVLIMICLTIVLRIQINSSFDRGRADHRRLFHQQHHRRVRPYPRKHQALRTRSMDNREEIVNRSISETLTRSLFTSLTTLITIGCVCAGRRFHQGICAADHHRSRCRDLFFRAAGRALLALLHKGQKKGHKA